MARERSKLKAYRVKQTPNILYSSVEPSMLPEPSASQRNVKQDIQCLNLRSLIGFVITSLGSRHKGIGDTRPYPRCSRVRIGSRWFGIHTVVLYRGGWRHIKKMYNVQLPRQVHK